MMREDADRKNRDNFMRCFMGSDEGRLVLKYLEEFCRGESAEFIADVRLAEYMQGRRSVYCEILRLCSLGITHDHF